LPFITIFKKIPIMEPLQTNKVQFNLNKNWKQTVVFQFLGLKPKVTVIQTDKLPYTFDVQNDRRSFSLNE
jgi:hypothetical protein